MDILFTVVIILVALLLIGVVLIQNSKGGGLASNIGISTQVMGVKKTTDTVEKATWWLIGIMVILCIFSGFAFSGGKRTTGSSQPESLNLEVPVSQNPNQLPPSSGPGQLPQ